MAAKIVKRKYAWTPDLPDQRDHKFALVAIPGAPVLPPSVDLTKFCSPVEDQGQLGSCTGNAIAGALEYLENTAAKASHLELGTSVPFFDVSRLFIYYQERVIEHTVKQDAGAMIRDGVKACNKIGYCTEKLWPYVIKKFATKPTAACYKDAGKRKITEYQRCSTLQDMKQSLAAGRPVVFGFTVYDSFESAQVAKTGIVNMPAKHEQVLGGHAVLMVGYDDHSQRVRVRNSWGPSWGQHGYFTMPYAYVEDRNLSDDFWSITK